jgi:hypothetical protein
VRGERVRLAGDAWHADAVSLHCPATVIVIAEMAEDEVLTRLLDRRVAAVYTGSAPDELGRAERLAAPLAAVPCGLPYLGGLSLADLVDHGWSPGPDAGPGAVVADIADRHRGETVVVLAATGGELEPAWVEVQVGDDGVRRTV